MTFPVIPVLAPILDPAPVALLFGATPRYVMLASGIGF